MKRIYIVGTADTKGEELAFLRALVAGTGFPCVLVDVGTQVSKIQTDFAIRDIAAQHNRSANAVLTADDRGAAVTAMGEAFASFISRRDDVAGVLGIGGGGGTSIITAGMRALPIGVPKLMVSTLASGDVGPFVDVSDIAMMYSVTDIAGLNRISRAVLTNAASAIVGMARAPATAADEKPAIGLTMFGVTTPCVTRAAEALRVDYDCIIFHATGSGGRAMEKLVDSAMLVGVLDATTTEVCDLLLGGVLSAGPDRLGAIARTRVPYVGSVGALDMVNFWGPDSVPEKYRGRLLYRHNPQVTLMRTTAEECLMIGSWIAERLNRCEGPVRFLIPEKGISALDAPGAAFHDPAADAALFDAIERTLKPAAARQLIRLPYHINDPEFADALVAQFREIMP
jgi:uncharacterized protein (UPF0261 family)